MILIFTAVMNIRCSHSIFVDIISAQTKCTQRRRETGRRRSTESVGSMKLMYMEPFLLANNREYLVVFMDAGEQRLQNCCYNLYNLPKILQRRERVALRPLLLYDKQVIGWYQSLCDCHLTKPKNPSSRVLPSRSMYANNNEAIKEPTNDLPKDMVYDNDARNLHFQIKLICSDGK